MILPPLVFPASILGSGVNRSTIVLLLLAKKCVHFSQALNIEVKFFFNFAFFKFNICSWTNSFFAISLVRNITRIDVIVQGILNGEVSLYH